MSTCCQCPWVAVVDKTGSTYWWNKSTNETTELGAKNPNLALSTDSTSTVPTTLLQPSTIPTTSLQNSMIPAKTEQTPMIPSTSLSPLLTIVKNELNNVKTVLSTYRTFAPDLVESIERKIDLIQRSRSSQIMKSNLEQLNTFVKDPNLFNCISSNETTNCEQNCKIMKDIVSDYKCKCDNICSGDILSLKNYINNDIKKIVDNALTELSGGRRHKKSKILRSKKRSGAKTQKKKVLKKLKKSIYRR